MALNNEIIYPFGFNASEKEQESLPKVFLHETAFNRKALDPTVSIIMGRRGSGKTALAQYMRFEHEKPYDIYIDIDEPKIFSHILEQLSRNLREQASLNVIDDVAKLWELSFWTSLMSGILSAENSHSSDTKDQIEKYLNHIGLKSNKTSQVIRAVFQGLASIASEKAGSLVDLAFKVNDILCSPEFNNAKASVTQYLNRGHRAVIIIDTLEQYDIRKEAMKQALGAMLQAVTNFSLGSIHKNLHIKCFLPSEIVPYLTESSIQNIGKSLEFPIFLHWRPRDLLRLACKRLFLTLEAERPSLIRGIRDIDWTDFTEVRNKVWNKFFPPIITNHLGFEEDSFQYVLRHTQLRPRQVIWICNSIAQACHERKAFPSISNNDVLKGVATVEETLASEVLNSFQSVYPRARNILASFRGQSNFMRQASYLDKLASRTKAVWDENDMPYDRNTFMQMCCEMGIIGSVVDKTDKVIKAEFEYTLTDRLYLNYNEECVIHPMFYKYFRISPLTDKIVYPIGPDTE